MGISLGRGHPSLLAQFLIKRRRRDERFCAASMTSAGAADLIVAVQCRSDAARALSVALPRIPVRQAQLGISNEGCWLGAYVDAANNSGSRSSGSIVWRRMCGGSA